MISTSKNSQPSVAVVIVNFNGLEYSSACIDSLLHIDYPNSRIVMVDNGSSDSSGSMLVQSYEGKIEPILLSVNGGVTGGNNAGIEYALKNNFDYVLFLNNDTEVHPSFLTGLIDASLSDGQALVVPKIVCYFDQRRLDHWIGSDIDWWTSRPIGYHYYPLESEEMNRKQRIGVASTCCLLVPLSVIRQIGLMDEDYFMYYDDADFTLRASRAGYSMIYEPASVVFHKCNKTTGTKQPSLFEYYLVNRNIFYFYGKFCNRPIVKSIVLAKIFTRLLLHFVGSLLLRKKRLQYVAYLTLRDIVRGVRGPIPPEFFGENKK
ncbi:MAG: glycosyltransferase family 2 protein [Elusimicrobia bacterium]|nr:glycosyltransferase family 2 protein [Elusimicrobiota bacterium]